MLRRHAVHGDDQVGRLKLADGVAPSVDRGDDHTTRLCDDLVTEATESDCGGDLLRDRHCAQVGLPRCLVAHARRHDFVRWHQRCAAVDPREEPLEHARVPFKDVDKVDAPWPFGVMSALHRHERRNRMRAVGKQQVVVRRDEIEDDRGQSKQAREEAHHLGGRR